LDSEYGPNGDKFFLLVSGRREVLMKAIRQMNILFRPGQLAFSAILVLAMLAAFFPQTAQAATICQSYHTFRSGDTRPSISQFYGLKWKAIAAANDMKPNQKPSAGQVLCIPAPSNSAKGSSTTSKTPTTGLFVPTNENGALFTVSITAHQINTTLANFSYFHVYMVKVRDARTTMGGWYHLGKITIITLARQSFSFTVPKNLIGTTSLSVCFKDQISGELVCRNAPNR
jgi:LysM domain